MKQAAPPPEDKNTPLWRLPELFPALPAEQMKALTALHSELVKASKTMNLVPANTLREADVLHFADSLLGTQLLLKANLPETIYDIGTGNGFPGLIVALLAPAKKIVIIERDSRKCEYLMTAAAAMGLKNVTIENKRLEDLKDNSIPCAVSRGFTSVSKAILVMRKVFPVGSTYYHMKNDAWGRELAEIPSQLCSIWTPGLLGHYELPPRKQQMTIVETKKIA